MIRVKRKADHIKYASLLGDGPVSSGFDDVNFMHNCLPNLNMQMLKLSTSIASIKLDNPLLINAITGGSDKVTEVNQMLAEVAAETGCAMAVGSQYGAVTRNEGIKSFEVVRKYNPEGIVLANMGANARVEDIERAVEMLKADGLQIHLNVAQELIMPEGDQDFNGYLQNIELICRKVHVPVIVKETGCGMMKQQVAQLLNCGVSVIDVGGVGGTNFVAIEATRRQDNLYQDLLGWGIPTALSILEARAVSDNSVGIIASGGIRSALDVAKALALGANAVAMAGNILRKVMVDGIAATAQEICEKLQLLRTIMLLTGCSSISALRETPLLFSGELYQYINCRGYDLARLSHKR